jgi:hypothetical protein
MQGNLLAISFNPSAPTVLKWLRLKVVGCIPYLHHWECSSLLGFHGYITVFSRCNHGNQSMYFTKDSEIKLNTLRTMKWIWLLLFLDFGTHGMINWSNDRSATIVSYQTKIENLPVRHFSAHVRLWSSPCRHSPLDWLPRWLATTVAYHHLQSVPHHGFCLKILEPHKGQCLRCEI